MQILMVMSNTVLALGIMRTLKRENDLATTEIPLDQDGSLSLDPEQPEPDVVILEPDPDIPLPTLLSQIFKRFPQPPTILINSLESSVKLYDHREIIINEPAELVSAIRDIQARKEGK